MPTRLLISLRDSYQHDRRPWLLAFAALLVYLPASLWGVPAFTAADRCHGWGNDDLVPLAALADAHNAFVQAKPDWNTAYPWFQYALLAALFAPYLFYLKLTGGLGAPTGAFPFGFTDPVQALTVMTVIGRSVSILLSMAMVVAAYHIGKRLVDRTTGTVAAVIALLIFPVAYYARVGNPDAAALGWLALSLAVVAACLDEGLTIRRGVWLAIFTALTFSTKEQHGAALLLVVPVIWIAAFWRGPVQTWRRWQGRYVAPAITAFTFIIVFLISSGAILAPTRFGRHFGILSQSFSSKATFVRYPFAAEGFAAQLRDLFFFLVDALSWPLVLAAVAGVLLLVVKNSWKGTFLLSAVSYGLLLTYARFSHLHYIIPLAFTLVPFAAFAMVWISRQGKALRVLSLAAGIWGVGTLLLQTVDLTHDMLHDSRDAATAWFHEHAAPGSRVLYFGAKHFQPNYDAGVISLNEEIRERALFTIQGEKPDYIAVNPDNTTFARGRVEWRSGKYSVRPHYLPDEVFEQLASGALGYRLVAQFQSPRLLPWLDRPFLSYPAVNIPIQIFAREDRAAGFPPLTFWNEAPHYPRSYRNREITAERIRADFPDSQF